MKKVMIAMLLMVASCQGFAKADKSDKADVAKLEIITSTKTARLVYVAGENRDVRVTIYDAAGNALMTDRIKGQQAFVRPYNFSKMEGKAYKMEITDGVSTYTRTLSFNADQTTAQNVTFKAFANPTDSEHVFRLKVYRENANPLKVQVLDANGEVMYNEVVNVEGSFTKDFQILAPATSLKLSDGTTQEVIAL